MPRGHAVGMNVRRNAHISSPLHAMDCVSPPGHLFPLVQYKHFWALTEYWNPGRQVQLSMVSEYSGDSNWTAHSLRTEPSQCEFLGQGRQTPLGFPDKVYHPGWHWHLSDNRLSPYPLSELHRQAPPVAGCMTECGGRHWRKHGVNMDSNHCVICGELYDLMSQNTM